MIALLLKFNRLTGILLLLLFLALPTMSIVGQTGSGHEQNETASSTATVTTDKDDYAPGEYVIITGTGWQPGERVDFTFEETPKPETCVNSHDNFAIADANGNIFYNEFLIKVNHIGVAFVLTATGQTSGRIAVTEFTDANVTFTASGLPNGATNQIIVTWNVVTVSGSAPLPNPSSGTREFVYPGPSSPAIPVRNDQSVTYSYNDLIISGTTYSAVGGSVQGANNGMGGQTINAVYSAVACVSPSISTVPSDKIITYGDPDPIFSVGASGDGLSYQWQYNTTGAPSVWNNVGANLNSYTVPSPNVSFSGRTYRVVITGNCGTVTSAPASLTVNKKNITGSFTAGNKVYNGETSATVATRSLTGVLSTDASNVSLTGGTATFATASAGTGKTVTLTGATLAGTVSGNYNLLSIGTTTADILAKDITGSFTVSNKVYDGNTSATVATRSLTGVLSTDAANVSLTGGTATFATASAGTGKIVTLTGATLAGTASGNYNLLSIGTTTADIIARDITGSFTVSNKVYDGNTSAIVNSRSLIGIVGTDNVNLNGGTATFDNKNVGIAKTVILNGYSLSGTAAGNYNLTTVTDANADITQAALTVSITADDREYDATTDATVVIAGISGILGSDDVTASASNGNFDDKNVGTDKTVTADIATAGTDAGNYSFNATATAFADITQAALTVSITADDKEYDATTAATVLVAGVSGILGSDDVTASASNGSFDNKNVGTDKTVTADIASAGTDAGNYSFNATATAFADITQAALSVSITADDKEYDATTDATVVVAGVSGILGSDDVTASASNGSFDDKNVGTDKTVTADIATAGADAGNYSFNTTATAFADITQAALTVSITADDKEYDTTTDATVLVAGIAGIIGSDDVTASASNGNFDDKNVGTDKTVTADIATAGTDAGNYSFNATATALADITQAAMTVSITADDKEYNATTDATVVVADVSGILGSDDVTASVSNGSFDDKNVGTNKTVTADIATAGIDAANYSFNATATALADITQAALTVSITADDKEYNATTDATVVVAGVSGTLGSDDVTASASNGSFDDKNVGTDKTVTADIATAGADAGNYSFNATATAFADITQAALTISTTADDKEYNATTAATVEVSNIVGILGSDDVTASASNGNFDDKNVGTDKTVTADIATAGTDAGNYSFNATATAFADITQAALTVSITADDKEYDATTAATVEVSNIVGILGSDDVTASASNGSFDDKNVGTNKTVTADIATAGTDAGNYSFNATATALADITQAALTVSITADDKEYNATTAATVEVSNIVGILGSDDVTASASNGSFDDKNVGTNKTVTADIATAGTDAGNYSFNATATAFADITQAALTVSITADDKEYDATTDATVVVAGIAGIIRSDDVTASASNGSFDDKNVGTNKTVTADIATAGTDAANYSFNATATALADITQAALTVSITADHKEYDATTAATVEVSNIVGILESDDVTASASNGSFDDKNVGTNKTVTADIATAGTDAGNYSFNTMATALADITQAALTVNITADDKEYDATTDATVVVADVSGILGSDDVTASASNGSFDNKNVGIDKTVTADIATAGTDAANYSFNATATAFADITQAALTVSITADDKEYDATTDATVVVADVSGILGSDDVTASASNGSFDNKNVGTDKTVTADIATAGTDAGNYSFNATATALADITQAALTVSITADDKEYDATTAVTVEVSNIVGILGSDDVTASASNGNFDNKNVGTNKTVTADIATAGTDAGNYSFNATATALADITQAALTVSITADDKEYDATTAATVVVADVSGILGSDDVTASASNGSFDNKNVGTNKTVTADIATAGTDAGNYSFNAMATAFADITQAALTVSITADDKEYDATTDATVVVAGIAGILGSDDVTASASNGNFDDKNVGTDKTVTADIATAGTDAANYSFNATATALADITAKALTIKANDAEKYCGQNDPEFSVSYDGFVPGEGRDNLNGELHFNTNSDNSEAGIFIITPAGLISDNYDISFEEGMLTINGVTIDASTSSNPVQLGTTATLSAQVTPAVAGVSVTFTLSEYNNTNTGIFAQAYTTTTGSNGIATVTVPNLPSDVYKVTVVAGGGCSESEAYLPVYDPDGGFVTGGGWIQSPGTAMESGATGKANFGFNAKYKNGKNNMTEVDGNTNFQFQAGDLHLKSISHDNMSLVISGAKATYRGVGTVNGAGTHKFLLIAIDGDVSGGGGVDKFRIKIWKDNSSGVLYDNQWMVDENSNDATIIGGGSIVIHKPKGPNNKSSETSEKAYSITEAQTLQIENLNSLEVAPNPMNSYADIKFSLKNELKADLWIFDINGRKLKNLYSSVVKANEVIEVRFERGNLMSGMYICKLVTGDGRSYEKQIVIR
ncbi:YDG domain-containing protein [Zunongwangia sp. H14]|uniref:YDG domain-containing protein n=1 Tax=Zunongwangia sp. H14 TaxID=3240792 RepID=UPI003567B707